MTASGIHAVELYLLSAAEVVHEESYRVPDGDSCHDWALGDRLHLLVSGKHNNIAGYRVTMAEAREKKWPRDSFRQTSIGGGHT